ncbi:MAG: SgcJ/EcaC family oxidoreductase [Vicinamibacterales bacterium]
MSATLVLAICLAIGIVPDQQSGAAQARDEAAIREVVKNYVDARKESDAAAISALFTDDADQLTSSGEWRRGRDNLVKGTLASSQANAGTRTITIETVRFPSADVAIADGRYTIAGAGGTRRMWTAFVLVKAESTWRIAAIRNMLPAAR